MTAPRPPAAHVCLRVGSRHRVVFVPFPAKAPMFVIGAGSALVSLTLPEQIEAGHVDFARQLAAKAWAYAVRWNADTGACHRYPTYLSPTR